jgi:hypothetical protein
LQSRRHGAQGERIGVADIPDRIVLKRHRDLEGRSRRIWWRHGIVALLAVFLVLGLLNVFGQAQTIVNTGTGAASLQLSAPSNLRGGLLYTVRFTISAKSDVKNAVLLLSSGWAEGKQINTIEPTPLGQASRNGDLLFTLGHIPAGQKYVLYMGFQVNPTHVGNESEDVTLYDGGRRLAHIERTVAVYP